MQGDSIRKDIKGVLSNLWELLKSVPKVKSEIDRFPHFRHAILAMNSQTVEDVIAFTGENENLVYHIWYEFMIGIDTLDGGRSWSAIDPNIFNKIEQILVIFATEMDEPYIIGSNRNPSPLNTNFWDTNELFTHPKWQEIRKITSILATDCDFT